MSTTNFVSGTVITHEWLNDVDEAVYQANSGITGAVDRTLVSKLSDTVSVKDFGAKGDGVTDDTAAIQAAIDSGKPYSENATSGKRIYLPAGKYKVTTLDLSDCHGVVLIGDGAQATEIFTSGTSQVIKAIGTASTPLNKAGIKDMTIRGGGKANTGAHGIDLLWANTCFLENLVVYGCRHAFNLEHQWQTYLNNCSVHGGGTDQSYVGVYLGATDLTYIDNAIIAHGVYVQGTSGYGFRIINGQGSKFTSCEAGGSPMINAWYIGDPSSGTVKCQWMHFTNCLGDTTVGPTWLLRQGTASELSQIQITNCWGGNGDTGFYLDGLSSSIISSTLAVGNTNSGILLNNSVQNIINSCLLTGNNESASASVGDIAVQGGSYNKITNNHSNSNAAGKSYLESSATNNNTVTGNSFLQGATIVGANTVVHRNQGFKTERSGSAQITSAATSVTVAHGLGITPTVDHVRLTPQDNMGSATKFWVSAADATNFTINVNIAPGSTITFGWAIDLIRFS